MHRYTEEQKEFIKQNVLGKKNDELAAIFNKQFNTNISPLEINYFKHNHHLKSGLDTKFQKGHITHNKGKKQIEYMTKETIERTKATRFKKGNIPQNYRPVGSERINVDGYIEIKVADPNKWQLKQRYIYEQHYGPIPDGYNIMFADKDKLNLDISNLILVSKSEDLIMNRNKLIYEDSELTKTGHLIAKVIDKTNKVKNERL